MPCTVEILAANLFNTVANKNEGEEDAGEGNADRVAKYSVDVLRECWSLRAVYF